MSADLRALWPRRIWFARHGRTDYNIADLVQGRLDPPLADPGRADAEAVAAALRPHPPARLLVSPRLRARQTAEIVVRAHPAPLRIVPGLAERDWGRYEGGRRDARPALLDPPTVEPWAAFLDRIERDLSAALANPAKAEDSLIVAHAGVFRALVALLALDAPTEAPLAHGRVVELTGPGPTVAWRLLPNGDA